MKQIYVNFRLICALTVCFLASVSAWAAGEKWQENLFSNGDLGKSMLENVAIEGKGVDLTTEKNATLNVPVRYNQNDEGKINWNNGTKLVFTAKDNVTGIVIDGDWAQFASADKGIYTNGIWSGSLAVGEVLTLTANDGININSIKVLYNGAEQEDEDEDEDTEVTITYNITKSYWATIGAERGEAIGTVNCDAKVFDHYEFTITCVEDPDIFISFANLKSIMGYITCYSWEGGNHDLYKGYHYVLTISAFDVPYLNAIPIATTTYEFVGEGKEPIVYNYDITVTKVGLRLNSQGLGYNVNGQSFDVTFSDPVKNVKAWWAKGFEGSTNFTATKKDTEGKVWTITMTESALTAEGGINVNITATDLEGHPLKTANAATPYAFSVQIDLAGEPAYYGATLTVGSKEIELSTETATEFGELPAGSTFTYTCEQADTKAVMFQIYDATAGEMLKSVVILYPTDGVVTAELAIKYALAAGHQYEAQFKEYNVENGLTTKQPTAENNYKFSGTADVPVYSTVKVVSVTPSTNEVITDKNSVVTITFSEAIKSLSVTAVLGQMSSVSVPAANITTQDNITWTIAVDESYFVDGSLSLNFVAKDNDGNRVTDPVDGVGTPETCYINYGWSSTIGLPTPKLAEAGKTLEAIKSLTFTYEGIGLNTDKATSSWNRITIAKDGAPLGIVITEGMFKVSGDEKVGGTELTLTLPVPLAENGVYTVSVPAYAFILGHEQSNFYSGDCQFDITVETAQSEGIELNITKKSWATIGDQNGEVIGTLNGDFVQFDHFEAEIRCQEDPDQYISFANVRSLGAELICYAWSGGHYTLNRGYHYTLIVKAFSVPYYGAEPIAIATYEFVGEGAEAAKYNEQLTLVNVGLKPNSLFLHGYDINGTTFDVTFSEPVSKVKVWWAMGMDGSTNFSAEKKSEDGTVWTIIMPETVLTDEGSMNVMIQAWDAKGVMAKGDNGDHAFAFDIVISESIPDDEDPEVAIKNIMLNENVKVYTLTGIRVLPAQMQKGNVYIINGKKVIF